MAKYISIAYSENGKSVKYFANNLKYAKNAQVIDESGRLFIVVDCFGIDHQDYITAMKRIIDFYKNLKISNKEWAEKSAAMMHKLIAEVAAQSK